MIVFVTVYSETRVLQGMRAKWTLTHSNDQAVIMRCCPDMKKNLLSAEHRIKRKGKLRLSLTGPYIIIIIKYLFWIDVH